MSDDLKLLYLGAPRTATTSIWRALKTHPNIATTKNKEILNHEWERSKFPEGYVKEFNINDNTKVLLDGTPCAYNHHYYMTKDIKNLFNLPTKIIYPIRNPFTRLYSNIKQNIVSQRYWEPRWGEKYKVSYIIDDRVVGSKIMEFFKFAMDTYNLRLANLITKDIMIFRLDQINFNDIFDFIGVEPIDVKFSVSNRMNIWLNSQFDKDRKEINKYWYIFRKNIAKIVLDDLLELKKYIYVEDWIEEANNILHDV